MVILNRAKKFLGEKHNEEHVQRFEDILRTQHDIEIIKYNRQGDDIDTDIPQGLGAYDAGSGAGGAA